MMEELVKEKKKAEEGKVTMMQELVKEKKKAEEEKVTIMEELVKEKNPNPATRIQIPDIFVDSLRKGGACGSSTVQGDN